MKEKKKGKKVIMEEGKDGKEGSVMKGREVKTGEREEREAKHK